MDKLFAESPNDVQWSVGWLASGEGAKVLDVDGQMAIRRNVGWRLCRTMDRVLSAAAIPYTCRLVAGKEV